MKICIINGPNLNLLGKREPETYGDCSFEDFYETLKKDFPLIEFDYFQSNHEGALIDQLQKVGFHCDGIILNPAAFSHTSIAIADTIRALPTPVIEVHISNIYKREAFRRHSYVSEVAQGVISGFGLHSYKLAVYSLMNA